jgi:hypothetical protein
VAEADPVSSEAERGPRPPHPSHARGGAPDGAERSAARFLVREEPGSGVVARGLLSGDDAPFMRVPTEENCAMTSSGQHGDPTSSMPQPIPPDGAGVSPPARGGGWHPGRLHLADQAIAAGTVLFLVVALLPWLRVHGIDVGGSFRTPGFSLNGFDLGLVTLAFVLLVLATVWTLLPSFTEMPVPFPRPAVTVGLTALAFLFTLTEWLRALDVGFSLIGLLAVLVAGATLGFAVLRLLADMDLPGLPGGLARVTRWADRPASLPGRGGGRAGRQQRPVAGQPVDGEPADPAGSLPPAGYGPPPSTGGEAGTDPGDRSADRDDP